MGPMMNNPLLQLIQFARGGGNPMTVLQQAARMNPQMWQFLNMVQGKSPDQLRQMAENAAKERGTTVEQVAQSLGLNVPK